MNFQKLKITYLKFPRVMHKIIVTIIILKPVEVNEKRRGNYTFFKQLPFSKFLYILREIYLFIPTSSEIQYVL